MDQNRLAHIDCLRALAALGIVVFHLRVIAAGGPLPVTEWWRNAIDQICGAGVPLFFVISAFLLAMLSSAYKPGTFPVLGFYAKRYFRIAPLFYVCIAAWSLQRGGAPFMNVLIPNVTFTFNLLPSTADSLVFAGWTIGVEMLFYAVYPALYRFLPGLTLKALACLISLVFYTYFQHQIDVYGIDQRYKLLTFLKFLPIFFVGMIAFDFYDKVKAIRFPRKLACGLFAGSAWMFWAILEHRTILVDDVYWQGVACALVVVALSLWPLGVNKPTAFVGRISYSIYLFHGLIIIEMGGAFHSIYGLGLPDMLSFFLALLLAFCAILPIAAVLYATVEQPGNWVGRQISRRLARKPAVRREAIRPAVRMAASAAFGD